MQESSGHGENQQQYSPDRYPWLRFLDSSIYQSISSTQFREVFETATLTEWYVGKGGMGGSGLELEEGWRGVSERGGGADETISILSVTS